MAWCAPWPPWSALLREGGDTVEVIGPDRFRTLPTPSYPEIRLALRPRAALARMADAFAPIAVHIATEGPLGWAMRGICRRARLALHHRLPHQVPGLPARPDRHPAAPRLGGAAALPRGGAGTFAATPSLREELARRGFTKVRPWTRGVDLDLFRPAAARPAGKACRGRSSSTPAGVAVEKNIEAFLRLDLPGSKVVVGDGPQRGALRSRFPAARFAGWRDGAALAAAYAGADVLVFPSRTDTFGLVILEAHGLRHAGRRLSGDRAARRHRRRAAPACWTRISAARRWRPCGATARAAAPTPRAFPGPPAQRRSAANSCLSGAERPRTNAK